MNLKDLFIMDPVELKSRRLEVEKVFHCNATLPDQVFRDGFTFFAFENFDYAMTDGFWPSVQELAETSGDDSVLIGVLDPDPLSFFKDGHGHYGWANIPVSISSDEYSDILHEDSASAVLPSGLHVIATTVIWVPKSAKWAILGDRDWETCVVGFRDDIPMGSLHGIRWALDIDLRYSFKHYTVTPDFAEKFCFNYGNSDWEDRPLQLVIGAADLVKGDVRLSGAALMTVNNELEPEFERTRFLGKAPFKVVHVMLRFGTQWGEPELGRINERHSEIDVGIEVPMSAVQGLDFEPLCSVVRKITLQVLVAIAQKYKLDGSVWEEQLASLGKTGGRC